MEIRQVGTDLETKCVGCGEVLLISDGDVLNFREGEIIELDGEEIPMMGGFLCSLCNKKENGDFDNSVTVGRLACLGCGKEFGLGNFHNSLDEDGNFKGVFCDECNEGE